MMFNQMKDEGRQRRVIPKLQDTQLAPRTRDSMASRRACLCTLVTLLSSTAAIELPLLPTPAAFVILPGERRRFAINSDRMRSLLARDACVAQLLERPEGNFDVAPILKVTDLCEDTGCAELTCVGRGRLSTLRVANAGPWDGHTLAKTDPLYDDAPSQQVDAVCLSVRMLYHSCQALAESARSGPCEQQCELSAAASDAVDLFEQPLEALLKERHASIDAALSGVHECERDLHTMASEARLQRTLLSLTTVRQHMVCAVPQLAVLRLLRARLVALGSSALPGRGQSTESPATTCGALANRIQSRRFHCL